MDVPLLAGPGRASIPPAVRLYPAGCRSAMQPCGTGQELPKSLPIRHHIRKGLDVPL